MVRERFHTPLQGSVRATSADFWSQSQHLETAPVSPLPRPLLGQGEGTEQADFTSGFRGSARRRIAMRVAFDIGGTFTDLIPLGRDKRVHNPNVLSILYRVGEDISACITCL